MTEKKSCLETLHHALQVVSPGCSPRITESLVALVDSSMQGEARHYHNLDHALMVAESADPLETLAGLFHDLVQIEADQALPTIVEEPLRGFIHSPSPLVFALVDSSQTREDRSFEMARLIFGLIPGQTLPQSGRNEFMSALAAIRILAPVTDEAALASLLVGIEATLPFRVSSECLRNADDTLRALDQRFSLGLSPQTMRGTLQRAVRVANRDLRSFGENDLHALLDDSWALMYETTPDLRGSAGIKLQQYRTALRKMTRFIESMSASLFFRRLDHEPDTPTFERMVNRATRNLEIIRPVMRCKLLAMLLIEAATDDVDAMISPQRHASANTRTTVEAGEPDVLSVLTPGQHATVEFDIRQSPLAHAIARQLSSAEIEASLASIDPTLPAPAQLLKRQPSELGTLARELSRTMTYRH